MSSICREATSKYASTSRRSSAASARRTTSTFSCDIAYSRSPAASRASASVPKFWHPGRLAVTRLDCLPPHFREGRTAFEAVTADSDADDQAVAPGFAHRQNLTTEIGEDGQQVPQPFTDALVTAVGTALHLHDARREFHVRVYEREVGVEIAPVQGVVRAIEQLHVLLRHHPPSICRSQVRVQHGP